MIPYWPELFRSITPYWLELFRSINPYWPEQFRSVNPYRPEPFNLMKSLWKGWNFRHCPKLSFPLCYPLNVWTVCICPSLFEHVTRKANVLCNTNLYIISRHYLFHFFISPKMLSIRQCCHVCKMGIRFALNIFLTFRSTSD